MKQKLINFLEKYLSRWWYPYLMAAIVGLDMFLLIMPNDLLVISAQLAQPKKFVRISFIISIGSSLGALTLASLLQMDPEWIRSLFPKLFASESWISIKNLVQHWGYLAVYLGAAGPVPQQPFVILGTLAELKIPLLVFALFCGRMTKYLVYGYLASFAPKLLERFYKRSA